MMEGKKLALYIRHRVLDGLDIGVKGTRAGGGDLGRKGRKGGRKRKK